MTLEEIWGALMCKNADLKCPEAKITMKSKNLKHLLQQVFDKGAASEKDRAKAAKTRKDLLDKMTGFSKNPGKDFEQMMKDFGIG